MRLCDIFDRLDGHKYPSLARLDRTLELPLGVLHAITRCMAESAVPRLVPLAAPPPFQLPFGSASSATPPPIAGYDPCAGSSASPHLRPPVPPPTLYDPFLGSASPPPPGLVAPRPHVPLGAPMMPPGATPGQAMTVEAGCVLALEGHDTVSTSEIKTGKSHSVNLSPGEAPPGTFYFGTLHSHPIDERSGTGTPHSDADFAVFQNNEHCIVQIVATGIFKPQRVSEVYVLVRSHETDIKMDLGLYDRMYVGRLRDLMSQNAPRSPEDGSLIEKWAMGGAARFATWAMAKKYRFAFYQGKGEGEVSRIDDTTAAIFPTVFPL